jgi:hypothetical protein
MALRFAVTAGVTFLAWAVAAVLSQSMGDAMTLSASVWLATGVTLARCWPSSHPSALPC